jgi:cation transport regulator ChaC
MLYFAYGSNMHRPVMRRHAPTATPLGVAELPGHRFVITADGYASVEPAAGQSVYGVLWRITPRDHATLDVWENVAAGLYRAETVAVRRGGRPQPALIYFARSGVEGKPRSGYMELVIQAARQWKLPQAYIASLQDWRAAPLHEGERRRGDFAWK